MQSLPDECLNIVFSLLDRKSLYKCLFVDRYWCRLSVPILWREPFGPNYTHPKASLIINTLLACLNEDEISSLIPCIISVNNKSPLFDYGSFVRKIDHEYFVGNVVAWLEDVKWQDCRAQKLINVIYNMIMRQGSNLQEFYLTVFHDDFEIPKISIFTNHLPGITNLRALYVDLDHLGTIGDVMKYQNAIEFLSMVSKSCNAIAHCDLWIPKLYSAFTEPILDLIKLQPLERMLIDLDLVEENDVKKILYSLEFRSETLKKLLLSGLHFCGIDLSFMSRLNYLERLEFEYCNGFTSKQFEIFSKENLLHLKELKLWFGSDEFRPLLNVMDSMINFLCCETLLKLSLDIVTPEAIKALKQSCPNITFLHIKIFSGKFLDSIIPLICELSSLKTLHIQIEVCAVDTGILVKILSDHVKSVEYLSLNFYVDLPSFEYFTDNCKANLIKWNILVDESHYEFFKKDYLSCVNNFQKIHNSLKVLGINNYNEWTSEESEIINSLKNQDVDIVLSNELYNLFNM